MLATMCEAIMPIGKRLGYDNYQMRTFSSHMLGTPPFRTLKEVVRDLRDDPDDAVRIAADELAVWRELPRPSHNSTNQFELVRGRKTYQRDVDAVGRGAAHYAGNNQRRFRAARSAVQALSSRLI